MMDVTKLNVHYVEYIYVGIKIAWKHFLPKMNVMLIYQRYMVDLGIFKIDIDIFLISRKKF